MEENPKDEDAKLGLARIHLARDEHDAAKELQLGVTGNEAERLKATLALAELAAALGEPAAVRANAEGGGAEAVDALGVLQAHEGTMPRRSRPSTRQGSTTRNWPRPGSARRRSTSST